jgi:CheY-like chemotaxis protein
MAAVNGGFMQIGVLLVEDIPALRQMLTCMLETFGSYKVACSVASAGAAGSR